MISFFRKLSETWPARILFIVLIIAFAVWGVGSVHLGSKDYVAKVDREGVTAQEFLIPYQTALNRYMAETHATSLPPEAVRDQLAYSILQHLIGQKALEIEAHKLGVTVSKNDIRDLIFSMPAFQDTNGHFNHALFLQVLAENNTNQQDFIERVRKELIAQQIIDTVTSGALAPLPLVEVIYKALHSARIYQQINIPVAAFHETPYPTETDLKRYWINHPAEFLVPETRQVEVVLISPAILARNITVSKADLKAAYQEKIAALKADPQTKNKPLPSFAEEEASLIAAVKADRAAALLNNNLPQIQDALASGNPLNRLPASLGFAHFTATVQNGGTLELPVALQKDGISSVTLAQIALKAFQLPVGTPSELLQGQNSAYYAVEVKKAVLPHRLSFAASKAKALTGWQAQYREKHAEKIATYLYLAALHGKNLAEAAHSSGFALHQPAPLTYENIGSVNAEVAQNLLTFKPGNATMIKTPTGFTVLKLLKIQEPDLKNHQEDLLALQRTLNQAEAYDLSVLYVFGLVNAGHPTIDQAHLQKAMAEVT